MSFLGHPPCSNPLIEIVVPRYESLSSSTTDADLILAGIGFFQDRTSRPLSLSPTRSGTGNDLSQQHQCMILINLHLQALDRRLSTHNSWTLHSNLSRFTLAKQKSSLQKTHTCPFGFLPPTTSSSPIRCSSTLLIGAPTPTTRPLSL